MGRAGLLGGHVAPRLDDGPLDLPGVLLGAGADLLGDVNALLAWLEEGTAGGSAELAADLLTLGLGGVLS